MKKLIALLMVCGFAFAFVACGGGSKNEAESADSTATETPAVTPADTTATDTTATDTTAAQ
jgi:hypothetical protein